MFEKHLWKSDILSIPNAGKYGPEITPYLHTCHAVFISYFLNVISWKLLVIKQLNILETIFEEGANFAPQAIKI